MNKRFIKSTFVCVLSAVWLSACGGSSGPDVVEPVLIAPVVDAGANQTVNEQTQVTLAATASDDGSIVSMSWSQNADVQVELTDGQSQTPSFTAPSVTESLTLTFTFTATDNDGLSSEDTVDIIVLPVIPPVVDAGANQTVNEQTQVTLTATASDDGSIASMSWSQSSDVQVELTDEQSQTPSFTAPSVTENLTLTFTFIATDNDGLSSEDTVDITVLPVNVLPVIEPFETIDVDEQTLVSLTAVASDTDGEIVGYVWQQSGGAEVALTGSDTQTVSFTSADIQQDEVYSFTVTVTDNEGGQASENVIVNVDADNESPTVTLSRDLWLPQSTPVTLTAEYGDSNGEVVAFNWSQIEGPTIAIENTTSASLTFTTPDIEQDQQVVRFSLEVTDNEGATSVDEIELLISSLQMNTFNGQEFKAGEKIVWEVTSTSFTSFSFESELDIGFDQRGTRATITVPHLAEPTAVHMVRKGNNDKLYLQDTVNLVPDDSIGFAKVDNTAAPEDNSFDVKRTIYRDLDRNYGIDKYVDLVVYDTQSVSWYRGTDNGFVDKKLIKDELADISDVHIVEDMRNSIGVAMYIFSEHGRLDYYTLSSTGGVTLEFVRQTRNWGLEGSLDWSTVVDFIDENLLKDVVGIYMMNGKLNLAWYEEYESDHILHVIDSDVLGNENGVVSVADINNDGRNDIVVLAQNSTVLTYQQTSDEVFEKRIVHVVEDPEVTFKPIKSMPLDINRDGFMDFVVLREFSHVNGAVTYRLNGLFNQGDGTFAYGEDITFLQAQFAEQFTLADMDNDGFEDIVVFNDFDRCSTCANFTLTKTGYFGWINNDGSDTFGQSKVLAYPPMYTSDSSSSAIESSVMHITDIDGDDKLDLAHGFHSDALEIKHYLRQ